MTVGVLIVAHAGLGEALRDTAAAIFGREAAHLSVLPVPARCDADGLCTLARTRMEALDRGDGVLVLSDLLGSTPCNIAARVAASGNSRMITGINLPMLLRVLNYPDLDLDTLAAKALEAGRNGVRHEGGVE